MEQYYTVFDATPKEEDDRNYLQVGLGMTRNHGFEPEIDLEENKVDFVEPYSEKDGKQIINERVEWHADAPLASPFDD